MSTSEKTTHQAPKCDPDRQFSIVSIGTVRPAHRHCYFVHLNVRTKGKEITDVLQGRQVLIAHFGRTIFLEAEELTPHFTK